MYIQSKYLKFNFKLNHKNNTIILYKIKNILISITSIFIISCLGVEGEGLYERFKGIESVLEQSPYSVKIGWSAVKNVEKYEIYISTSDAPIGVTSNKEFIVTNLEPNRLYIFAVNAVYFDGREEGISFEKQVVMWDKFKGIQRGESLNYDQVDLYWDYPYDNVRYNVYVAKLNENFNLNSTSFTTTSNQIRVTGLQGDTDYKFIVRASYSDNTTDDNTKVLTIRTKVGVNPMPVISINKVTISTLPSVRISNAPMAYLVQVRNSINDALVCEKKINQTSVLCYPGTLQVGFNDLYATVKDPINNTATIYGLFTVVKRLELASPSLVPYYNISRPFVDTKNAPHGYDAGGHNVSPVFSSLGHSNAQNVRVGDFNCDGYMDLVIGVPGGTHDSEIYAVNANDRSNTNLQAKSFGYIVVYYGSAAGFATEPDLIYSFQNEAEGVFVTSPGSGYNAGGWGFSIAVGNFNGNVYNGNSCDDIAVSSRHHNRLGAFGVLYGHQEGLQVTTHITRLQSSVGPHCSGSTCNRAFFIPTNIVRENSNSFGASLAAGDIDGDGFEDLVIGMYNINSVNEQKVFVFFGSSNGLGVIDNDIKYIVIENEINKNTMHRFGANLTLASLKGSNKDLIITATGINGSHREGKLIYIPAVDISFLKNNLSSGSNIYDLESFINKQIIGVHPSATPINSSTKASFTFIDSAGDINGDGFEDIVVGSLDDSRISGETGNLYQGAYYVVYGSSTGPQSFTGVLTDYTSNTEACDIYNSCKIQRIANPDRTKTCPGMTSSYCFYAPHISSYDLNKDGYSDLLVSFPTKPKNVNNQLVGELHVYYGSETGLKPVVKRILPNKNASEAEFDFADMFAYRNVAGIFNSIEQESTAAKIISVAYKKDIGPEEITPLAYQISQRIGQGGLISEFNANDNKPYDRTININYTRFENEFFDNLVFNIGDVNGDGYDDVVMKGASYYTDTHGSRNFYGVIYYGSSIGLVTERNSNCSLNYSYEKIDGLTCPQIINSRYIYQELEGVHRNYFSYIIHGAGDVNGDGYDDIISVGTGVYLFYGSLYGPIINTAPSVNPTYYTDPKIINMASGSGVEPVTNFYRYLSIYGYHNYSGYYYSNGHALKITNGDFNGDGYSDIVFFSSSSAAIILYGSSSGIQSDGYLKLYNTSNSEGNILRASLIGTPNYPKQCNGEICYGLYLNPSHNNEDQNNYVDGLQKCTHSTMLNSINNLGDINGDGFDDLALIRPLCTGWEARVYIYYGSNEGLLVNGESLAVTGGASIQSPQLIHLASNGDGYGLVNTNSYAGDINGDGYNDFVLGASEVGTRIFVFYGSPSGLQTFLPSETPNTPSMFLSTSPGLNHFKTFSSCEGNPSPGFNDTTCRPLRIENPNNTILNGYTINGAGRNGTMSVGDINGDGYSDILQTYANCYKNTGPIHTGCVVVYFGSKYGLRTFNEFNNAPLNQLSHISTNPSCNINEGLGCGPLIIIPDIPYLQLGKFSYFLSGDYNGDGSSDVLIGSKNIFFNYIKSNDERILPYTEKTSTGHLWYIYK